MTYFSSHDCSLTLFSFQISVDPLSFTSSLDNPYPYIRRSRITVMMQEEDIKDDEEEGNDDLT